MSWHTHPIVMNGTSDNNPLLLKIVYFLPAALLVATILECLSQSHLNFWRDVT